MGALELVNEPLQNTEDGNTAWMVEHFYPTAIDRIRAKESSLGVSSGDSLHIITMVRPLESVAYLGHNDSRGVAKKYGLG